MVYYIGLMRPIKASIATTPPLTPDDTDSSNDRVVMREAHTLPAVETWPHRPLMVTLNSSVSPCLNVPNHGQSSCPIGVPFDFSSELFEGQIIIRLKDCNSDNIDGDATYFEGRKRIFQSVVQGRFKERVSVSDVLTGHEFAKPLKNLPRPLILKMATALASKIAPGVGVCVQSEQPYIKAILLSASKAVRCDEPGREPDIASHDIKENCSLFGGEFSEEKVSISRRKRIFSDPVKCQNYMFDTDKVYTFESYDDVFSAPDYVLDLGFTTLGLKSILDGQPIQRLGKHRDGRYLWSFQIWHEKLLPTNKKSILLDD